MFINIVKTRNLFLLQVCGVREDNVKRNLASRYIIRIEVIRALRIANRTGISVMRALV